MSAVHASPAAPVPLFTQLNAASVDGQQVSPDGHCHGLSLQGTPLLDFELLEQAKAMASPRRAPATLVTRTTRPPLPVGRTPALDAAA
jgi:hypothetical protein